MEELIEYILQFGNLNKPKIDLVTKKATELELRKDEYFSEAGKTPRQIGFNVEGCRTNRYCTVSSIYGKISKSCQPNSTFLSGFLPRYYAIIIKQNQKKY
jgi:hypothetical protein